VGGEKKTKKMGAVWVGKHRWGPKMGDEKNNTKNMIPWVPKVF